MKKLKTRNEYVRRCGKCRYYADTFTATSYNHWHFVKKINGKIVFNDFNYSHTTNKHQWEMRSLLDSLNIKIDYFVDSNYSLDDSRWGNDALYRLYDNAIELIVKKHTPRIRKVTKDDIDASLICIRKKIKEIESFGYTFKKKDILKIYRRKKEIRDGKEVIMKWKKDKEVFLFNNEKGKSYTIKQVKTTNDGTWVIYKSNQSNYEISSLLFLALKSKPNKLATILR